MNLRTCKTVKERRGLIEKECKVPLPHIGSFSLDEHTASTRNCENMIGATQIPLGVAGPLRIQNSESRIQNDFYIPLATTEGALVASVNRGCKAITESGGVQVLCNKVGATRGPVFKVRSLQENSELFDFLMEHEDEIKKIAESSDKIKKYLGGKTIRKIIFVANKLINFVVN